MQLGLHSSEDWSTHQVTEFDPPDMLPGQPHLASHRTVNASRTPGEYGQLGQARRKPTAWPGYIETGLPFGYSTVVRDIPHAATVTLVSPWLLDGIHNVGMGGRPGRLWSSIGNVRSPKRSSRQHPCSSFCADCGSVPRPTWAAGAGD